MAIRGSGSTTEGRGGRHGTRWWSSNPWVGLGYSYGHIWPHMALGNSTPPISHGYGLPLLLLLVDRLQVLPNPCVTSRMSWQGLGWVARCWAQVTPSGLDRVSLCWCTMVQGAAQATPGKQHDACVRPGEAPGRLLVGEAEGQAGGRDVRSRHLGGGWVS